MKGLFLFHRDFRIVDNNGLIEASKKCDQLYTCFVFTREQVMKNSFKSKNSIQFMIESLENLAQEIKKNGGKLLCFYGNTNDCLKILIKELQIEGIFFNEDYSSYAKERIESIEKMCKKEKIECNYYHDYYLHEPGSITNNSGGIYMKFTPFYEKAIIDKEFDVVSNYKIKHLTSTNKKFSFVVDLKEAGKKFVGDSNNELAVHGGRENALQQLKHALQHLNKYSETRDDISEETSMLSAYIKYGCISIREVCHKFKIKYGKHNEFIRQLIWRDFYMHILDRHPESLGQLYNKKLSSVKWNENISHLNHWKNGTTGFPLVDAGMRQLNKTGYMHNRVRMIVATFLSKVLYLNWKEGEKYFAQQLVDYDVASNSGNWQAVVGGGMYSMPYFRVLNPWVQSEKNDHDCIYIKRWIPELKDLDNKNIHKWYKYYKKNKNVNYPEPIVNFDVQVEKYLQKIKNL